MQWLQDTNGSAPLAVTASHTHSSHCVVPHYVEATEKKFCGWWKWRCRMILMLRLTVCFPPAPSDLCQAAQGICYYRSYHVIFVDRITKWLEGSIVVRYISSHGKRSHGETSRLVCTVPKREATRTIFSIICGAFLFCHVLCICLCVL
jgi:hypothetical protein